MSAYVNNQTAVDFLKDKTLVTDRAPVIENGAILAGGVDSDRVSFSSHIVQELVPVTNVNWGTQPLQFDITNGLVTEIDNILLHMQVNCSGGTATCVPAPFLVDHLTVTVNGSSTIIQYLTGDNLYQQISLWTYPQLQRFLANNAMNISATDYHSPTGMSSGQTSDFYIPLPMLVPLLINFLTTANTVSVFVYPVASAAAATYATGNGGVLSLTGQCTLQLLNHSDQGSDQAIAKLYKQFPARITFPDFFNNRYSYTLTPSTKTTISITNINRQVTLAIVTIRGSNTTGSGCCTFLDLSGGAPLNYSNSYIDLQNQSGISMVGSRPLAQGELALNMFGNLPNWVSNTVNTYWFRFTTDPISAFFSGNQSKGARLVSENMTLVLYPGSNFNSGSALACTIDVMFVSHHELVQDTRGNFRLDH